MQYLGIKVLIRLELIILNLNQEIQRDKIELNKAVEAYESLAVLLKGFESKNKGMIG